MKTRLLSITLLFLLPLGAAAQTADEIVKKALEARGGVEKIKAVRSERVSGHVSFSQTMEGTFVVELKRPLKMHVEITIDGQKIIRVYDGKSSGWMVNPFLETKEVQPLSPDDLKNISDESDFDGPLVDYKSKGNQIEFVGKENLDDKPVYRLKLTNKSGDVRYYFFDASSYLLLKWEGIRKSGEQELPWESFFSDFHEVQELKFPFRIDQGSPGTELKQILIAEKIELNPQIEDSRFTKPVPATPASPPPTN
jgi:outer membrane lipoprotein-sorting protein